MLENGFGGRSFSSGNVVQGFSPAFYVLGDQSGFSPRGNALLGFKVSSGDLILRELKLSTTSQATNESTPTTAQRIPWAILIALTLYVCYFSHLDVIGFVGPDEPRYAWIARDMAETGDWITPRLYGRPWFEKPPLLYWGGAIFFKLLGEGRPEVAARLPSAISALLATLALAWLAWRVYGEECARWLLLLLPTSVGMIGFSHACATDMPFAGMLTVALVCAAVVLRLIPATESTPILPRTPWLALVLLGFFLGLAVLAKGPAAIILTGGAVFFWALFTKRWRDAFRALHPAAIAALCLTALPWYILCARRNSDFFRIFIIEHNFKRYLTPEFQHIQPFWFYVPILLIALLPWTVITIGTMVLGIQDRLRQERTSAVTVFLLSWALFCFGFFSFSRSKLPGYILPAIPAIGLLFVRKLETGIATKSMLLKYACLWSSIIFSLIAGISSFWALLATRPHVNLKAVAAASTPWFFAIANLFLLAAFLRSSVGVRAGIVTPILAVILFSSWLIPGLVPVDPSGKTLAREISSHDIKDGVAVHGMRRGIHFSANFYLRQELPEWDSAHPISGYLVLSGKNCEQVVSGSASCQELPIFLESSRRFIYRVKAQDSLGGLGRGGQPH